MATETLVERTVLLDISPRLQWENGNGYCGETAIQCFGLYTISTNIHRTSVSKSV